MATAVAHSLTDRFALVLCGGVSLMYKSYRGTMARSPSEGGVAAHGGGNMKVLNVTSPFYDPKLPPTPLRITLASLKQHVVDANDPTGGSRFDVFAHSWAPSLEGAYRAALNLTAAAFEDNRPVQAELWDGGRRGLYHNASDWHQISYGLSMARAANLVLDHLAASAASAAESTSPASGTRTRTRTPHVSSYARIVFVRADVLLTRDLDLMALPPSDRLVYVSGYRQPALTWR